MPAFDRYDGPLWQTLRTVDPTRSKTTVAYLSARYGFGDAATPIEDYNLRLTPGLAARMIAGGVNTRWPRPPKPRDPDTFGDSAAVNITSMSRFGDSPFEDVALVGGHIYLSVMRAFLPEFIRLGGITPTVEITVINDTIGFMRPALRQWVDKEQPHDKP